MVTTNIVATNDGVPILDKNNIINVRDGESLYQICIKLRRRLSGVPGFQPYLDEMEEKELEGSDPVSSLWQCFRSGLPLLAIYNASQPDDGELKVKTTQPERVGKEAAFLFIKACMQQMNIPAAETFTVTELYNDNTTGFVKVTKLVNRVLDLLRMSGKLQTSTDSESSGDGIDSNRKSVPPVPKQMTRRDHILKELVDSERHYVHHLQNLQAMKKDLEETGALTGDAIHNVFLNLNNLLDFAQRFLIRIEQQHELPAEDQNWGQLFMRYKDPFRQYEPFIANQRRCEATVAKEWIKMCAAPGTPLMNQMLANPTILNGFLLKPFQRLTKYPLLLKDLEKQTESEKLKSDITQAVGIIHEVLQQADASIDKETRDDALADLEERIEDWKNLGFASMGELLLLGTFNVIKEGVVRSEEKEYHIYLFQRILVMCKDVNAAKQKKKGLPGLSKHGKPYMHIKGRIYFANVLSATASSTPGTYTLQISWKGERDQVNAEMFVIKFKNDETLRKWHTMIQTQRSACLIEKGTSNTVLTSLKDLQIENPFAVEDDDEDYSRMSGTTYAGGSEYGMSRNASNNSLHSRATGASATSITPHPSNGRLRGPAGDMVHLPLLNTHLPMPSPGQVGGESYFSPTGGDTPPLSASTRSSSQLTFAGYQRNITPVSSVMTAMTESSYRNTAPAMGRNGNSSGNPYLQNGRSPMRPSLPVGAVQSANTFSMNRMRSASSPDINPQMQQNRKYANGEIIPNVPPIPAHVSKQMGPPSRSQNNSPSNPVSMRSSNPQVYPSSGARPPMSAHGYSYDPVYSGPEMRKHGHAGHSSGDRTTSPPSSEGESSMPVQLRAKVQFKDNYVSMIIPSSIHFRSLTDRIDAKLSRFTNYSIASGSVKLRYQDEDGDFILIDSDEAVHEALLEWRETSADRSSNGLSTEILLFAHLVHES